MKDQSGKRLEVLVMKFFGLGSIILSTGALSVLRSRFPQSRITFLSFSANRGLLERLPLLDEVLTIDPSSPASFFRDVLSLLRRMSGVRYDIVIDFEFFSKFSTALSGFSRAPYRVGFALPVRWRQSLLTHSVPLVKGRHVREAFCSLVHSWCGTGDVGDLVPPLILSDDLASLQKKIHLNGGSIIVVNVNAGDTFPERRWPQHRFAALISRLSSGRDSTIVLTGTESERTYVQEVIDRTESADRCINAAGLLTIPELGALLQRCEFMVSNDSGPLHLAAVLGTPSIGLFGPETPEFYGPLGPSAISVYRKTSCSPCMNIYSAKSFQCPYDAKCMRDIKLKDIEEAIEEVAEASWLA